MDISSLQIGRHGNICQWHHPVGGQTLVVSQRDFCWPVCRLPLIANDHSFSFFGSDGHQIPVVRRVYAHVYSAIALDMEMRILRAPLPTRHHTYIHTHPPSDTMLCATCCSHAACCPLCWFVRSTHNVCVYFVCLSFFLYLFAFFGHCLCNSVKKIECDYLCIYQSDKN